MCPDCDEPLVIYEVDGVEIDHCLSCGGTWLDAGELELLLELSGSAAGGLTRALEEARVLRRGDRRCPRCRRRLDVVALLPPRGGEAADGGIELDRCPLGQGFWLDCGETTAIIERFGGSDSEREDSARGDESAVAAFFRDLYRSRLDPPDSKGEE